MPDDRDQYRKRTPPHGVRAQTAPPVGEFDNADLTPVYGTPEVQTLKRAEQAAESGKSAAGTSRAALKIVEQLGKDQSALRDEVKEVRREVQAYAETDQRDHKEMKGGLAETKTTLSDVKSELKTQSADIKTQGEHIGDIREKLGVIVGKIETWDDQISLQRQNAAHEERIRFSYKTKVKLKWWDLVMKILAAGGVVLAGYEASKLIGIAH